MRILLVLFSFFFLLSNPSWATKPKTVLMADSSAVQIRKPSEDQLNQYRKSPEYQYIKEASPPSQSILGDLFRRFFNWLNDFFNQPKYGTTRSVLLYLFLGGALVFVILKLIGVEFTSLFTKKSDGLQVPFVAFGEDLNTIDFKNQIEQAITQKNYRLAVRLLYLQMLKELSDRSLIVWQTNKTNRSYGYEIKPHLRQTFDTLTQQFEYAWYGEFPVDEKKFEAIRNKTSQFYQEIKQ